MNKIVLSGNIAKDAELRFTPDGTPVSNFPLAVRQYRRKDDKQTLFLDMVVWGKRAEALNTYLQKGKSIIVEGRLDVSKRAAENGKTYTNVRVYVSDLEFVGKKDQGQDSKPEEQAPVVDEAESIEEVPF
ncbi:MAG: single-stranded DNA-binding protein [bacterium]